MDDLVRFASRDYALLFALLLFARGMDFLSTWINGGPGAEVLSTTAMRYFCRCTRESLLAALAGFGQDQVDELFKDGDPVSVRCDYCGKDYRVSRGDLPGGGRP